MSPVHGLTAILPCNDLDASEAFYNRLGFSRPASERTAAGDEDSYRILTDGKGGPMYWNDWGSPLEFTVNSADRPYTFPPRRNTVVPLMLGLSEPQQ